MSDLAHAFFEADIRVESITWLPSIACGIRDDDFLEWTIADASSGEPWVHPTMSIFKNMPEWALADDDGFSEWLHDSDLEGFVVNVATPKPVAFHDGGYTTHSFGLAATTAIYVQDLKEVLPTAIAWKDEQMAKWRAEAS